MLLKKEREIKEPADGDYKITLHYAWLPVKTKDGTVWMERYKKVWLYATRPRLIDLHLAMIKTICGAWDLMEVKRCPRIER